MSDLKKAKNWLAAWLGRYFTAEELKRHANLNIGVPALARKLRLYRENGELESRTREGKTYKEYRYNPARLIAMATARQEADKKLIGWL